MYQAVLGGDRGETLAGRRNCKMNVLQVSLVTLLATAYPAFDWQISNAAFHQQLLIKAPGLHFSEGGAYELRPLVGISDEQRNLPIHLFGSWPIAEPSTGVYGHKDVAKNNILLVMYLLRKSHCLRVVSLLQCSDLILAGFYTRVLFRMIQTQQILNEPPWLI
ncbi:hypothetical protein XENORESO_004834 [Xenotaenia resolanae]|uniref:Uncharacterized protein n=1 Tax=Xenotaenia resolanae TaxID=208358 RepID=A0ABV0X8E4_9TELE